ncbi:heparinase II/III family protein [Alphaproteobacteria bacterium]|nr:heparinase II/III family protein [Alphaproteobacteria bacterium]
MWFNFIKPRPDKSLRPHVRKLVGKWLSPACRNKSLVEENTFFFLNQKGSLADDGWDNPERDKLWRYNQHYFDDLNAEKAHERIKWHNILLKKWINENTPGAGSGWEPYPTSLRIVNWIKWHCVGNLLNDECLHSLAVQARWLYRRIEWHLLGNHLFANAKALVFAGVFFKGKEAESWLSMGLNIIKNELPEQVLQDGGNFELSPMYHSIFLEDLMDLNNLSRAYTNSLPKNQTVLWEKTTKAMLNFLEGICHPDGEIPMFNDSAFGISPHPLKLFKYAKRLGIHNTNLVFKESNLSLKQYVQSGYICLESPFAFCILDVARVGPDYLPAHAHSDTLSFELSLFGKRFIVNGGTSTYKRSYIRQFERSTSAHNTVEIDGKNSSEVWSEFRVARRAYPINLKIEEDNKLIQVLCSHNGYHNFLDRTTHERKWIFTKDKLLIKDKILGKFKKAIARFYFHPNIQVIDKRIGTYLLEVEGKTIVIKIIVGEGKIEPGFYAPEFGIREKTNCLAVDFGNDYSSVVEISWGI